MDQSKINSENYQKQKKITDEIDFLISSVHKDTAHSSSQNYEKHPDFKKLVDMGDKIIPYLFHKAMQSGWNWVIIRLLKETSKVSPVPKEHYGNFYWIIKDWIEWYLLSDYYNNSDIYFGLVD